MESSGPIVALAAFLIPLLLLLGIAALGVLAGRAWRSHRRKKRYPWKVRDKD